MASDKYRYKFELNVGHECNFGCKYCFECGKRDTTEVSEEKLLAFAEYVKYWYFKLGPEHIWHFVVYGGEPLLYMSKYPRLFRQIQWLMNSIALVTNGSLVHKYQKELLALKERLGPAFDCVVSYDFALQDETRKEGTYQLVRDNIRWLAQHEMCNRCSSVFTYSTLHRIDEVFFDFVELWKEFPDMKLGFNIARHGNEDETVDFPALEAALIRIRAYMDEHPEIEPHFFYNYSVGYTGDRAPECVFANILAAMDPNGDVYPGYNFPYENEYIRETFCFGNIMDGIPALESKRKALINELPDTPPPGCGSCDANCRIIPWIYMEDDLSQYNIPPAEPHCSAHKLVTKYITERRDPAFRVE